MSLAPIHPTRNDIENVARSLAVHLGHFEGLTEIFPRDEWERTLECSDGQSDIKFVCNDRQHTL